MTQKYTVNPAERFQVRVLVGLQTSRVINLRLVGSKLPIDYSVWCTAERSTDSPNADGERGCGIKVRILFS